ncbi:MAG: DUF1232 domain-containing protein [Nocardioidaceae bacterium]|nr:DUF1232 domain-containing protein [Nocardioidaceae bacterium]
MNLWNTLLGVAAGLLLLWLALVVALYVAGRRQDEPTRLRDVLRLIPDVVRLLKRLAADPTLPRGVRIRLVALLVYLALPIDLVPDFIPVAGYADDALIVAFALRSVTRRAGVEAIDRHWPGTDEGLAAVKRLAGL